MITAKKQALFYLDYDGYKYPRYEHSAGDHGSLADANSRQRRPWDAEEAREVDIPKSRLDSSKGVYVIPPTKLNMGVNELLEVGKKLGIGDTLKAAGFDTIKLSGNVDFHPIAHDRLIEQLTVARDTARSEFQSFSDVQYLLHHSEPFEVCASVGKGMNNYQFMIRLPGIAQVWFSDDRDNGKVGNVYIKLLSVGLWHYGLSGCASRVCDFLLQLTRFQLASPEYEPFDFKVSQVDFCVDLLIDEYDPIRFISDVCNKRLKDSSGKCEDTVYFGSRRSRMLRVYPKAAEAVKSGKLDLMMAIWEEIDLIELSKIVRIEWSAKRDRLRKFGIVTLDQLVSCPHDLFQSCFLFSEPFGGETKKSYLAACSAMHAYLEARPEAGVILADTLPKRVPVPFTHDMRIMRRLVPELAYIASEHGLESKEALLQVIDELLSSREVQERMQLKGVDFLNPVPF